MTVGVVLPVYDGAEYIESAIDSVLAQTHEDLELVVVDDGSTDGTTALVRSYDDARVILLRNDRNRGVGASRNRGVEYVDGDLLAFIDHDDVWHPEKLTRHLEVHQTTDADVVYSDVRQVAADGDVLGTEPKPEPRPVGEPLVRQLFFRTGAIITTMSSVTIRRSAWMAVGGEDPEYNVTGDVDLYVRLADDHGFSRVPDALVDRRHHGRNISADYWGIYRNQERLIDRATARYDFLDATDVRRKRARMGYRLATSALADGAPIDAFRAACSSVGHGRYGRPLLVMLLAGLDILSGPLVAGQRLFLAYDRRARSWSEPRS